MTVAAEGTFSKFIRIVAPVVWRDDVRIAAKLRGFSATEAGSALDMLKAAELEPDPRRRRLYFRHALDEARHSRMFADLARRIDPQFSGRKSAKYTLIAATRQNLYYHFALPEFLAFVWIAERNGEAHFRGLIRHFQSRDDLRQLFERIAKDEVFHIKYSRRLLDELAQAGEAAAVRRAIRNIRWFRFWTAWKRAGRQIGDLVSKLLLHACYYTILAPFAVLQRLMDKAPRGWVIERDAESPSSVPALEEARRMF
jgi:rubrerythrin